MNNQKVSRSAMIPMTHFLLAISIGLIWGVNFIAIKIGVQEISPYMLAVLRFFFTSIPAVFFIKRPPVPFKIILAYGLSMFTAQSVFLFVAIMQGLPTGLASVLGQTQIFFTMALAVLFLKEKVYWWNLVGVAISIIGIGMIGLHVQLSIPLMGLFAMFAAAFAWSIGNVISKKYLQKIEVVPLVVWGSLVAWPPLLLGIVASEQTVGCITCLAHISWSSIGAVLYITLCSTLFGFAVWGWLLKKHPVSTIAPFSLLVPIFGLLSSVIVFHESMNTWKLCAIALVFIGLCINVFGYRLRRKSDL
jgi:O-acetylserine/cysteine efflux transporter